MQAQKDYKPSCVFSEAVTVSADELMTELLRRFPGEDLAQALKAAAESAAKRTEKRRHVRYKTERFFRKVAQRLPSETLAESIVTATPENKPVRIVQTRPEPQTKPQPLLKTGCIPPNPSFADVKSVFDSYPHVKEFIMGEGALQRRVIAVGYLSKYITKRGSEEKILVRYNCQTITSDGQRGQVFNDLRGLYPMIKMEVGGVHFSVKVIEYPIKPFGFRFWTNRSDVGDVLNGYKYAHIDRFGVTVDLNEADFTYLMGGKGGR